MKKWIFSIIILVVLALSVQGVLGAQESLVASNSSHISEAPLNPEFIEYYNTSHVVERVKSINSEHHLGLVPEPVDTTYLTGKKVSKKALVAEMQGIADVSAVDMGDIVSAPATYDLRTLGRVSPVKDQGYCGSCWAFATYGSMESEALPGQVYDFSENNLKNTHGFDWGPCDGGNSGISTAYLARWGGPVAEVDDPYVDYSTTSPSNLPLQEHAQEILLIPGRSGPLDNDNIKAALQTTGALYTNMYWSGTYYNTSSRAYYYNGASSSNHAVTIVGWDDTYSRNNFYPVAPGDGAFIIKNSWGTSFGNNGYFYQSYYDSRVGKSLTAFSGESAATYNHVYQYDPLGWINNFGYGSDTAWAANIFTTTSGESLAAVGFSTNQVDTAYQVFIYTNPDQGPISSAGPVSSVQGTIAIPGYHTIALPAPVSLNTGQKFSVVIRFETPNNNYPIPIEMPVNGYSSQATASAGQSYTSNTGLIWTDITTVYPNTNVCLKAYTGNTLPVAAFSATPTSGMVPLAVQFNDTTPGGITTMWNWSFGDSSWFNTTLASERNTTHIYTTAGTYTAYLTISNTGSSSVSDGKTITVTLSPQLNADFTANTFSGTEPLTITFSDQSTGSPTGWAWYFGDEDFTEPWMQVNASAGWMARMHHSSVVMPDGSIVLMGGDGNGGKNDTWRSTDNGTTWILVNASSGWSERYGHSSVVMPDGSIVLMGGCYGDSNCRNDTWRSTDSGATWMLMNVSSGWSGRCIHSSVAMPDGSIVLMGGFTDDPFLNNDVWRSMDYGATWTLVNASPGWSERRGHSSVVMPDGSIVLMGGESTDGGSGLKNDTWKSMDNGDTWTQMTANAEWSGRDYHSSVVMPDGSILLMGGWSFDDLSLKNDVWRSTDNGRLWVQVNASAGWSGRQGHSSVVMPDGSIVLIGGEGSIFTDDYKNDTWQLMPAGSSAQNPSHTYTKHGTYQVALQVFNADGYTSVRKAGYITITDSSQLNADFTTNTSSGTAPLAVLFTDTSTGSTPTMWNWSFGDGSWFNTSQASERNTTHIYTSTGTYTAYLTISNASESSTSAGKTIAIILPPFLTAAFTTNTSSGIAPLAVAFADTTVGDTPTMWNWSFGDGNWYNTTVAANRNVTHIYTSYGTPISRLTVANANGADTTNPGTTITVIGIPTITSISPASGPVAGGTAVTITGTGFTGATAVTFGTLFGTTPGTNLQVTNDNTLTITSPARAAGTVDIRVTTPGGTSAIVTGDKFIYTPAPKVTSISPANGPVVGGTAVTITGSGFTSASTVTFGTIAAASVTYNSATRLTATSPAGSNTVDVRVTTPSGTSAVVTGDTFTYYEIPAVTSISPANGPAAGGTAVTITGTGFTSASTVTIGTVKASVTYISATSLTATSPAGTGTVDIRVTTLGGTSPISQPADQFTYAPTVTSISPANGPAAGGTTIMITGTGFTGASTVTFGTTPGTDLQVTNDNTLTVTSPAGTGSVDVQVTTPSGTSPVTRPADQFTYAPTVTSISPTNGPATGGTTITITGTGFTNTSKVSFGTIAAASVTYNSATSLTATSPAGTGTVDIRVTTPSGTSAIVTEDTFTYVPVPTVTSISPASGPAAGGTAVTITGTGFTGATAVMFGTTPGTDLQVTNDNTLTITSPARAAGTVDIRVTTPGGTSSIVTGDKFIYAPTPTVTRISPANGPAAGGTAVTITGSGFTSASTVTFGTVAASVTYNSATRLTATSPAGTGTVDVRVTTPSGTSAVVTGDTFTYYEIPSVSGISPANGPAAGGTAVTITGTGFTSASTVKFGSVKASVTYNSATSLTATSPAGTGTVDIRVTTLGGTSPISQPADQFTYAPTVTSISPTSGPVAGGTAVTITGTGFTGASTVTFGTTPGTDLQVTNDNTLTVTSPAGTGSVDVQVTTPGGTSPVTRPADQFTYAPTVTSISPANGPAAGGTAVTITGTGFTNTSKVSFGTIAAASVTYNSATSLTATSPAGTGTVDIRVTTPSGTSAIVTEDTFTYVPVPTVTSISPASGPAAGGTAVTITGTGFTGATAVMFGTNPGTDLQVTTDNTLTVTSPARAAGTVDIRVTTPGGTSAIVTGDKFIYAPAPKVTSISPANGPVIGGTAVTISGTGFTSASTVTFGTVAASVTYNSATRLTATSPAGTDTVDIRVTTPSGTSAIVAGDKFTYYEIPLVSSISPANGPAAGGTAVTITGTGFTSASTVKFGTVKASVTYISATSLTATSPAGSGTVDIRVTTLGGTSPITQPADQFTYAPTVTSISPTSGPVAGGTAVTISGTGFTGATAVTFGTTPGTDLQVTNDNTLTVTSPAGTGSVDVQVTTPGGTSPVTRPADQFTYAPTVTSISPTSGPVAGGTVVTITGTMFTNTSTVSFGTIAAASVTYNSATSLTATSPAGTGTVDIRVTTPSGTSAIVTGDKFTYVPVPTVTSISPASGSAAGGTPVTITGTGFTGATAVTFGTMFGTTPGTDLQVTNDNTLTITSPTRAAGTVDIRVTTPGGTSAIVTGDKFIYTPVPTVTRISPANGPAAGGTAVTISGTGFTSASTVTFGTVAASVTYNSATRLTATSPAGSDTVDVRVTTPSGTSAVVPLDTFTYNA